MTFSVSISGHAADPSEEATLRDRFRELVASLLDPEESGIELELSSAAFVGSYGSENLLTTARPEIATEDPLDEDDEEGSE